MKSHRMKIHDFPRDSDIDWNLKAVSLLLSINVSVQTESYNLTYFKPCEMQLVASESNLEGNVLSFFF